MINQMRLARGLCALVLLPALLTGGAGSVYAQFRCRIDQIARRVCCCPNESVASQAAIAEACCCDSETVRIAPAPSGDVRIELAAVVPDLIASPLSLEQATLETRSLSVLPAVRGPPLILVKQSFLI
jgi:hypothetical protein